MTRTMLRIIHMGILGLLCLAGTQPAQAQLNPKYWQKLDQTTDFMDLYQQTNAQTVKPEIVTLLDYSGSMNQIMFDGRFFNNITEEATTNGCEIAIKIKPSGTYANTSTSWELDTLTLVRTASHGAVGSITGKDWGTGASVTYTIGGTRANGNMLIRPDGAGGYVEVTAPYVNNTTVVSQYVKPGQLDVLVGSGTGSYPKSSSALNWMRAATHARVKVAWGSTSRFVDIPLNWTVLNAGSYMDKPPLKPAVSKDPITNEEFAYDTTFVNGNTQYTCWSGVNANYSISSGSSASFTDRAYVGAEYAAWAGWRETYLAWIFSGKTSGGAYCIQSSDSQPGFGNGLKGLTRLQAVKQAIVETWLQYQNDVYWMIRGLDPDESATTNVSPQITTLGNNLVALESNDVSGGDNRWFTLNKHKGDGLRRVAKQVANTGTPLTTSYSNTLVQFMNKTAMQEIAAGEQQTLECTKHFLIICTDGSPSGDQSPKEAVVNQAYFDSTGKGDRVTGNNKIKGAGLSSFNISQTYWNVPTLAGIAAHGGKIKATDTDYIDDNTGDNISNSSAPLSSFAPLFIPGRPSMTFKLSHPIQTMTLGMSMAVTLDGSGTPIPIQSDPTSAKYRLLAAATVGNPSVNSWDLTTAKAFDATAAQPTYFFDATSPDSMVDNLKEAFKQAIAMGAVSSTAMPGFPFVGTGVGNQVYMAQFYPNEDGGVVWAGDLMMFPTRTDNSIMKVLNADGTQVSGTLRPDKAGWSAGRLFDPESGKFQRKWYERRIYTRVPKYDNLGTTPLGKGGQVVRFQMDDSGTEGGYSDFKRALPSSSASDSNLAADDAARKKLIRWMMGGDVEVKDDTDVTKIPNRVKYDATLGKFLKGIVGDIISSAPVAVEYASLPSSLPPNSPLVSAYSSNSGARFRVVFVGTNLGMLHAFGEVTWNTTQKVGSDSVSVTNGAVDELWAFIPSDFLPYLYYLYTPAGSGFLGATSLRHRYGVDGLPFVYHLDLPSSGQAKGNDKIDAGEKAVLVFGLGKGGRSYYALDIHDPSKPSITSDAGWALVPDEESSTTTTVAKMGLSTCQPLIGRMITGADTKILSDVIFLGGGLSNTYLDDGFFQSGKSALLGRSALALDVVSGATYQAWDLSSVLTSSVPAGVVPFEMVPNSGLTQRAYFSTYDGKVYSLGRNAYSSAYAGFITDTSDLTGWATTARLVYKADFTPALSNVTSQLPAPFRVTGYPFRRTSPLVSPPTVGIAMTTGDRNNPADNYPKTVNASDMPSNFRTVVFFDRGDHMLLDSAKAGIGNAALVDFSTVAPTDTRIKPGSSDYYLDPTSGTPKLGYYLNYPTKNSAGFIAKSFAPPVVFLGVMAYTYFQPTGYDPCLGGDGRSATNRICDVMLPWFPGNGSSVDTQTYSLNNCKAGEVWNWVGVASRLSLKSLNTAVQSGLATDADSGGSATTPALTMKSMTGRQSDRFVRPRVWRTVTY